VAQPEQTFQILKGDVVKRLTTLSGQQFDRIYFDPPYASNLYQPVLEAIAHHQLLHLNGEIAVEHGLDTWTPKSLPSLEICRQKIYGNTGVTFYRIEDKDND